MAKIINTPLTPEVINNLMAGDRVLLNGIIYTGRDAAHKRLAAVSYTHLAERHSERSEESHHLNNFIFPSSFKYLTVMATIGPNITPATENSLKPAYIAVIVIIG